MKGWFAASTALLFLIPVAGFAAADLSAAARELARKTAAFAGRDEPVSISWRNTSALGPSEQAQARAAFEAALRDSGARIADTPSNVDARLTLSENRTEYLLVEEIRRGGDRQVWIAAWKRAEAPVPRTPGMALEKKLLWDDDEPILDVAFPPDAMLVLTRSKIRLFARNGTGWDPKATTPVTPAKPWPRDPRARLRWNGSTAVAYLPGAQCTVAIEPALSLECRPGDDPWTLESGTRHLLLAAFAPQRNYFDGRVTSQTGLRKTVSPFYSAAAVEEQGRPLWLLAALDGKTQLFDAALEPAGAIGAWGSDIAGIDTRCVAGSAVLATRPGDASASDTVQAYSIANRAALPVSQPVEFRGPVTALWPSGAGSAVAIIRNAETGRYEAYLLAVTCGS